MSMKTPLLRRIAKMIYGPKKRITKDVIIDLVSQNTLIDSRGNLLPEGQIRFCVSGILTALKLSDTPYLEYRDILGMRNLLGMETKQVLDTNQSNTWVH